MKRGSTLFAKAVVYLVGLAALAVCFILIPELVREEGVGKPFNPYMTYSFFAVVYILAAPFFVALYQSLRFLTYIDKNKAFSKRSIKAIRNIKICVIVFTILFAVAVTAGVSMLRIMNPTEDAPPFMLFGFIVTFVSSVIAVFIAVVQKLLTEAVEMKSENDSII
jgi:hypothetical protein